MKGGNCEQPLREGGQQQRWLPGLRGGMRFFRLGDVSRRALLEVTVAEGWGWPLQVGQLHAVTLWVQSGDVLRVLCAFGGDDALGAAAALALSPFCLRFRTFLGCSTWSLHLECSDVHPGAGLGSGAMLEASQTLAACLASQNPGSVYRMLLLGRS